MIYVTVALCALILALLVIRYDMYDREPWYMLVVAAGLGLFSCRTVGCVEDWCLVRFADPHALAVHAAVAATFEEAFKILAVLTIAVCFRSHFNDPMDGIIYGAFAGLGFAICESTFYIELARSWHPKPTHPQLFGQEAIRLSLHLLTGAIGSFGLGLARYRIRHWKLILPTWVAAAVAIHFLWDWACGLPAAGESSYLFQRSTAVCLMLFATFMFAVAVITGIRWSQLVHPTNCTGRHLLGWPFSLLARQSARR
jgi:RsiW-degrading membrane proteinase PrsW (M82 family)